MRATRQRAARVGYAYEYCEWKRGEMADRDRGRESGDAGRIANAFSIDSNRK